MAYHHCNRGYRIGDNNWFDVNLCYFMLVKQKDTETDVSIKLGLARLGLAMKKQEIEDQEKLIHDLQNVKFSKNNKHTHV